MQTVVGKIRHLKIQNDGCQHYSFFIPMVDESLMVSTTLGQLVTTSD